MADLSKITLPDNTQVTLRDKSQERSDHRHFDSDIVPLVHKKYESTSYYATTASSYETSTWYFMSVRPTEWYKPWRVKFKVHSYCPKESGGTPSYPSYQSYTWATVCGRAESTIYANWNEKYDNAHYYTTIYPLKKVGFDAGYGHALGISIIYGAGYTNSNCYRTFEVDYYECENCTVTILDTPVKWASWTGTGTTNYGNLVAMDAVNRGLQETGDNNTVTENRIGYFAGKTGAKGIWGYSLFMEDANGTYQNICTAADGTVTSSNRTTATTKIANTNGFKVLGTIWYTSTTYAANTNISGNAVVYSAISLFDSRYAFNTTLTANSLTPYKEVYLVGTIHDDGLFYLDSTWWTQTPNDTTKIYVLVGACFDSTTSYCRATLYEQNKWYKYDGTKLVEISGDALSVNGHTVEADVPSDAEFTDTTYTFANGTNGFTVTPSGGTAQTVTVTPSIANNITGTGTSGYLTKFNGTNTITNGPALGSDTTKFLRNDGTWQVPSTGTDENVKQTATTTSSDYEVLFSGTADNTTRTEGARKNSNLKFNPSTGNLQATQLNGVTIGSSPKFTDNNTTYSLTQDSTDGHKITLTPSSGTAQTVTIPDNNTTYTFATGDNNGQIKVTPSSGSAQNVSVKGLGSAAYKSITDSYSATGTDAVSGKAVKAALDTLDGTVTGSAGAGKTLTSFSQTDGKVSATFGDISITKSQVSDFPSTMPPSAHTHHDEDIVPLIHKTYESTSYYGTANDWANATWYFMSVRPDDWNKPWRVKIKLHSYCPGYATYQSYTWAMIYGRMNDWSYVNYNERNYRAHNYVAIYRLKKAGFDAGYGHAIGVSIYNSDTPTSSAYYRTFEVDYYDCENCTVTLLDTPVKWADWSGTGTTNYESITSADASTRGLCETNDANDGRYYTERIYTIIKAGANKVYPYTLIMQTANGAWESFVLSNTTAATKSKNPHGFLLGQIYYCSSGSTYESGTVLGNYILYESYGNLIDHRYSFNTENNATNGLTANLPVYLIGTLGNDGLFYLADKWWGQELPSTDDGKLYIRLGDAYDRYRMPLDLKHPVYRYVNGAIREFTPDSATVDGHSIAKDVPSDAKFTDTTYTFTNGDDSFSVTPSGGSAQTVKVTSYHLKNTDNRSDNQLPSWYMTNHPRSTIQEFKSCSAIGVNSLISTAYCILTTIIPWTDISGGGPVQIATSNAGVRAQRVSLDANTWGSWIALPNSDTTYTGTSPISVSGTTISHATSGVTAGTYKSVTVDAKGHVTAGTNPTTLSGYGITDAKIANGTITLGSNTITPLTGTSNLKEAYLTWGGKNFSGTYGCLDAAMVPELGANRFMYYTASGITIEYTRDGGTTWQDYGATDAQKVGLFSVGQAFYIGKADSTDKATAHGTDYQLRVTLSTYGILYTQLNKFILYVSTGGSAQPKVTIQKAKGNAPDTFEEVATDIPINGWSGYNVINVDPFTTYGNTIGSQYGYIRFIFTANGGDTNYIGLSVSKILGFGGAGWTTPTDMAKTGHLYSYDVNKNATFPGGMTIKGDVLISKDRKTDSLMFNGYNDAKVGFKLSENGRNMDLGWDWNSYAGSGAYFRAATHSNAGRFGFYARKSGATVHLIGDTNGSLTWNSKRVVTATDGTQIGGPTTPVYVNSSGYVTACSLSTRNIFVETVTTPYNVGDLWLGSDGTFQCITAKASGEFDIENWEEIPNGYLDTDEVTALINQNTQIVTGNGSILWHDSNNDGKYDEILLIRNDATADPVTLSNATSVYKFYNGGLYYSSTGYNGTYSTILTPDGKGVADFLQYGTLDASKVNIVNFNSSMITAGLLKRGGTDNNFGEIEVYNASGILIGKIDNAGFTFYGAGQAGQRPYIKINDTVGFAGYDAADNIVFQVVGDEFRAKKMVVSDEISVGGKLKFLPITIKEGNTVVNDGIAFVGLV